MSARLVLLLVSLLALATTACSRNFFFATAPAKTGWIYVVGSKNDRAQAWLCPAAPGKGQCHEIDVVEVDR
ncbi:MAG: hypothetical protein JWP87_380 [Labilithrix sp.]|nr:hypothetical protein [Labilithrix sp.]